MLEGVDPIYNFENYPLELKYRLQTAATEAKNNLIASKETRKLKYDKKYKCHFINFKQGDKVMIKNDDKNIKMEANFKGPYVIIKDKNSNIVVKIDNKLVEVHKNRVKLYYS